MLKGTGLVLWSVLLGMELAEYFIQNQLSITSVSHCFWTIDDGQCIDNFKGFAQYCFNGYVDRITAECSRFS